MEMEMERNQTENMVITWSHIQYLQKILTAEQLTLALRNGVFLQPKDGKPPGLFYVKKDTNVICSYLSRSQASQIVGRSGKNIEDLRKRFDVDINVSFRGKPLVKISGKDKERVYNIILTQII